MIQINLNNLQGNGKNCEISNELAVCVFNVLG